MLFKNLALMTIAAVAVNAQIPGITPCILACVQPAATQNGCTFTDAQCVCASAQFQADATKCLTDNCTADDVQAALNLQTAQCGAIGVTPSGSATPNPVSFTLSGSDSATSSPAPSTSGGSSTTSGSSTPTSARSSTPGSSTPTSPSQTSPAPTTKPSGAASPLVAGSGAFIGAILAGVLAL
ncbi:hypothetical protein BJ165DRAFT_432847 [Panaeolus papilionaceus]|nr:hypothetical protein BJ165DRAFT_432847 [Panaeolus papilionaceus]